MRLRLCHKKGGGLGYAIRPKFPSYTQSDQSLPLFSLCRSLIIHRVSTIKSIGSLERHGKLRSIESRWSVRVRIIFQLWAMPVCEKSGTDNLCQIPRRALARSLRSRRQTWKYSRTKKLPFAMLIIRPNHRQSVLLKVNKKNHAQDRFLRF